MSFRLHHVLVVTEPGAPVADTIAGFGLVEGAPNTHPGQGSANRRFFFEDMGLELGFFTDEEEAQTGPGRVIRMFDRWNTPGGSRLGLIFRADGDTGDFPGFPYQPLYFEDGQFFLLGDNTDVLGEPIVVLMPRNLPNRPPQDLSPPPFRRVTAVRVSVPVESSSSALSWAAGIDRVTIETGAQECMEIEFEGGVNGETQDLRPEIPLVLRW